MESQFPHLLNGNDSTHRDHTQPQRRGSGAGCLAEVTTATGDPRSRSLGHDVFMTTLRADIYGVLSFPCMVSLYPPAAHEVTPIILPRHSHQGGGQSHPRAPDPTTMHTSPKPSPVFLVNPFLSLMCRYFCDAYNLIIS